MEWSEEKARLTIRKRDGQDGGNSHEAQRVARSSRTLPLSHTRLLVTPNTIFAHASLTNPSSTKSDSCFGGDDVIIGPKVGEALALCERPLGLDHSTPWSSLVEFYLVASADCDTVNLMVTKC